MCLSQDGLELLNSSTYHLGIYRFTEKVRFRVWPQKKHSMMKFCMRVQDNFSFVRPVHLSVALQKNEKTNKKRNNNEVINACNY